RAHPWCGRRHRDRDLRDGADRTALARQSGHRVGRSGFRPSLRVTRPGRTVAPCALELFWFWWQQLQPDSGSAAMSAPNSAPLQAWIEGIGFIAPGMPDWPSGRAVLRGEQAFVSAPSVLPVPTLLPPAERRRASRVIKVALGLGLEAVAQAGADLTTLATVFSASGADGHNCHALCEQL